MENIGELGVGGIFALLILKEVFNFIKARKPSNGSKTSSGSNPKIDKMGNLVEEIKDKIDDLHKWHDVIDNEGVKVWYVRKSLEDAVERLSASIERQTELLRVITEEFKASRRDFKYLSEEIHDLKKINKIA